MNRLNLNPTVTEVDRAMELSDGRRVDLNEIPTDAVVHWGVYDEHTGHVIRLCIVARYNGDMGRARNAEAYLRSVMRWNLFVDPNDPADLDGLNCDGCIAQRQA